MNTNTTTYIEDITRLALICSDPSTPANNYKKYSAAINRYLRNENSFLKQIVVFMSKN